MSKNWWRRAGWLGVISLVVFLYSLWVIPAVWAGEISITINNQVELVTITEQGDKVLSRLIEDVNKRKDLDNDTLTCAKDADEPCFTVSSFMALVISSRVESFVKSQMVVDTKRACKVIDPTELERVTKLVGHNPCRGK